MPIFGLVWVASWVNCFFSSSQDLLRAPSYLANIPTQTAAQVSGTRSALLPTAHKPLKTVLSISSPQHAFSQLMQPVQSGLSASALPFSLDAPLPALGFFGAVKGLISGFQKLTAIHPSIPVVVTQADPTQVAKASVSHSSTAGLGFGQCLPIVQDDAMQADHSSSQRSPHRFFQVKVKGHVVSAAPEQQQAKQIAHRLEQVLSEAKPPLQQIQPGIINGIPVGRIGDRVLFTVDQQVSAQWDCNPEMLAIQWINDLRKAVAQPPLSLADAQTKMYGLQATGQYIDGLASWYGPYFHGRQTATGEIFNQDDFTAAHPSLPFNTYLKVTNIGNGKTVIVRVND